MADGQSVEDHSTLRQSVTIHQTAPLKSVDRV